MKNIVRIARNLVLVIAFLNIFAFSVRQVTMGKGGLGKFSEPLKEFSNFPHLVGEVFKEATVSSRTVKVDTSFKYLNNLEEDVFALNGRFHNSQWLISLTNLRTDSIVHEWYLNEKNYLNTTNIVFSHARPFASILLEDRSVVIQNVSTNNLFRLNSRSEVVWHNTDFIFHHSMNLDSDKNIWVCTRKKIKLKDYKNFSYLDDYITQIDSNTGKPLFNKSIREIFIENSMDYLVYGLEYHINPSTTELVDPFHLNDIEPVLRGGSFWNEGDLFISLRNQSMIFLYRPSTNKILKVIQGPFYNQHDVDVQTDSTITFFNNNLRYILEDGSVEKYFPKFQPDPSSSIGRISEILQYNFKDGTFSKNFVNQFIFNKIFTRTEGLHHILSNGKMFVESQNEGKIYILDENEVVLRKYANPIIDNRTEVPHWTRIYENINF